MTARSRDGRAAAAAVEIISISIKSYMADHLMFNVQPAYIRLTDKVPTRRLAGTARAGTCRLSFRLKYRATTSGCWSVRRL